MTASATLNRSGLTDDPAAGHLASLAKTLDIELAALGALRQQLETGLGAGLVAAISAIRAARGRVVVTGIGKSGHIGRKITATLASTGTPAFFVHPSEASHGDLGMIASDDVVLAISASGESSELAAVISYTRRFSVVLVAMTANAQSSLGRAADIVLELPKVAEACPHGLAPTSSTLLQLATGDALAIALLEARGFSAQDFRVFHPGGKLGASLKRVSDIMHRDDKVPLVASGVSMRDAILVMSAKGFGCVGVVDGEGRVIGIVTDGDLRRHLSADMLNEPVDEVMTPRPKCIGPDVLLPKAIEILASSSITALLVVEAERPVGIIHMHDLLRTGIA